MSAGRWLPLAGFADENTPGHGRKAGQTKALRQVPGQGRDAVKSSGLMLLT
ncbi:MAG: hypothetical protein J5846_01195 [Desulfovibrio sp.]|nr:hypothetical protein [Desulfovibrio sp.]